MYLLIYLYYIDRYVMGTHPQSGLINSFEKMERPMFHPLNWDLYSLHRSMSKGSIDETELIHRLI